jgi:predicted transcriptional regulator
MGFNMIRTKKIHIGIVGPDHTLQIIKKIALSYTEASWRFYIYEDPNEAFELVMKHLHSVDVFLFAGEFSYQSVLNKNNDINKPMLYIPHTGISLYRTLFEMTFHHQISLERVSMDTLSESIVKEAFQELDIPYSQVYLTSVLCPEKDPKSWGNFHLQLWKENKVDSIITTTRATYNYLIQNKAPVFGVRPTESTIRECLENAIHMGALQFAKRGQVLIQLIYIDNLSELIRYYGSEYELQKVRLELYKRLLDYAQEIQGAFTPLGNDSFLLVTTQGAYQQYTGGKLLNPIPVWVLENLPLSISVGIGEGQTGSGAETNARIALKYAQEQGGGCSFLVTSNGDVNGPLTNEKPLSFAYQLDGKQFEIAKKAKVSPATIGKISSALEKLQRNQLTAVELSQALKITPRATRRILSQLEKAKVVVRIGEESTSSMGRPRTIYKINI